MMNYLLMVSVFHVLYALVLPVYCDNNFQECGIRNEVGDGSDMNTILLEYPWHVVLYRQLNSNIPPEYICGGSIIDRNRILTAAHCVYNEDTCDTENAKLIAVVGKCDSLWDYRGPDEQRFEVVEIKLPATYFGFFGKYSDDIAVLMLNESIKFSNAVMPVCIDWTAEIQQVLSHGTVVGWKVNKNNTFSAKLVVAKIEYYDFITCWKTVSERFLSFVTSDKFCGTFRSSAVSSRRGDGGGFVVPVKSTKNVEKYYLRGILSAKDQDSNLTSYTDVNKHLKWLDSIQTPDTNSELPKFVADYGGGFQACGFRYDVNSHIPAISHGYKAMHSEFPWHVPIYRQFSSDQHPEYICGGSIILRKIILSAAHCFYEDATHGLTNATFTVIAGKYYRSWYQKDNSEQRFKVVEIKIPETYKSFLNRYADDLAVLVLKESINFSSLVMPICIDWNPKIKIQEKTDTGVVVGWGLTENKSLSDVLLVAKLKYYNFISCSNRFKDEGFANYVTSDKFCAGLDNGTVVEQGDSGGGLVFLRGSFGNKQQYYLRGIVSTKDTSDTNIATFTDINKHLKWIENIISPFVETEYCPVLSSSSVELEHCRSNNTDVDCNTLARVGTTGKVLCKKSFHAEFPFTLYTEAECKKNLAWSPLLESCIDCGKRFKFNDYVPLIIIGLSHMGQKLFELPWHVVIYREHHDAYEPEYEEVCGGTIIHPKAVLTAAHCLFDELNSKLIDAELISVATNGKYKRSLNESFSFDQRFQASRIYIKSTYTGSDNRFADDIAVIELHRIIRFSDYIMPACIDWAGKLQLHKKPYLSGLGAVMKEKELTTVNWSFLNLKRCRQTIFEKDMDYLPLLTSDKWCGISSNDTFISIKDTGGSMTFLAYNEETGKQAYYIYGIISSISKLKIVGVTDVIYHIEWIKETMMSITNSVFIN